MSGDKDLGKRVDYHAERFYDRVNGAFRGTGNFLMRNYIFPVVTSATLIAFGGYQLLMNLKHEPIPVAREQLKESEGPIANDYQPTPAPNPTENDIHLHDVVNGDASIIKYWRHRAEETKKSTEKRVGLSGEQSEESLDTKLNGP